MSFDIAYSDEYEKTLKKARAVKSLQELISGFIKWKQEKPHEPLNGQLSKDDKLKGGALKDLGTWHLDIGREFRLYYVPIYKKKVIFIQGIYTHEETGTGTPAKQPKQQAFAQRIRNSMEKKGLLERIENALQYGPKILG